MANILLKNKSNFEAIKTLIQSMDVTFRTGGTVSNYASAIKTNGYGLDLWEALFLGTQSIREIYFLQLFWTKNYLDVIGEMIAGKKVIFVANIFKSPDEVVIAVKKLQSYNCNVIAVELGNEQYLKARGLNVNDYLLLCKKFEALPYRKLYQLTNGEKLGWDNAVQQENRLYTYHCYANDLNDFINKMNLIKTNNPFAPIYLTEWNTINGFTDEAAYYNFVEGALNYCNQNKIINCFHNLVGNTWGIFNDQLKIRKGLFDLFVR